MDAALKPVAVVGRILLALIYVLGGINKIGNVDGTAAYMAANHIPAANVLVFGAIVMELGGGLLLMIGLYARWAALAIFCYTAFLAFHFHAYWTAPPAQAAAQHAIFFGHVSMMGGMLLVVALGAGAWSLDAHFGRQKRPGAGFAASPAPHS